MQASAQTIAIAAPADVKNHKADDQSLANQAIGRAVIVHLNQSSEAKYCTFDVKKIMPDTYEQIGKFYLDYPIAKRFIPMPKDLSDQLVAACSLWLSLELDDKDAKSAQFFEKLKTEKGNIQLESFSILAEQDRHLPRGLVLKRDRAKAAGLTLICNGDSQYLANDDPRLLNFKAQEIENIFMHQLAVVKPLATSNDSNRIVLIAELNKIFLMALNDAAKSRTIPMRDYSQLSADILSFIDQANEAGNAATVANGIKKLDNILVNAIAEFIRLGFNSVVTNPPCIRGELILRWKNAGKTLRNAAADVKVNKEAFRFMVKEHLALINDMGEASKVTMLYNAAKNRQYGKVMVLLDEGKDIIDFTIKCTDKLQTVEELLMQQDNEAAKGVLQRIRTIKNPASANNAAAAGAGAEQPPKAAPKSN